MSLIATTHALWEENFTKPKNKNVIYIYIYISQGLKTKMFYVYIIQLFTIIMEEDLNLNYLPIKACHNILYKKLTLQKKSINVTEIWMVPPYYHQSIKKMENS